MNSHIRVPRNVTVHPIGTPSRSLKFAIDVRALVMIGFCPAIWASSSTALSNKREFAIAAPMPMLSLTATILGIAIGDLYVNSVCMAGTTSLTYFSFMRSAAIIQTPP